MIFKTQKDREISLLPMRRLISLSRMLVEVLCLIVTFIAQASESNSLVCVSVVEYNCPTEQDEKLLLEQYHRGTEHVVFTASLMLDDKAKTLHTDMQWVLIPVGFQHEGLSLPNPMNYMRRGLGTQVRIHRVDKKQILVKMIREYVVGMTEARMATPTTFVQPTVKRREIESSVLVEPGERIIGGGWHEDSTNKTYYLIVKQY